MASKKKKPLSPGEHQRYKTRLKEKSDKRIQKREDTRGNRRAKAGRTTVGVKKGPSVSTDVRKEVVKGSKASGVTVDNKFVRKGKVKAAEKAVRRGTIQAVGRAVSKRIMGPTTRIMSEKEMVRRYNKSK